MRPCRLTHREGVRFANPLLVAVRDLVRKTAKAAREPAAALDVLRRR